MTRRGVFSLLAVIAAVGLASGAEARELTELRDRIRDGVQRTDKDFGKVVHREKLNAQQREKFDSAVKDLGEIREAVASGKWQDERERFEKMIDNLDFVTKNAPISDEDRQTLGIDVYSLQVILDSWKPQGK